MKTSQTAILLVLMSSFIGSFGAVFLKAGANRLGGGLMTVVTNWRLFAGIAAFLLSSVFYVSAVKQGELTILYPMVSLGYLWTMLWSRLFFGEPLTRFKLIGLALILSGIVCLGLGTRG